MYYYYYKQTEFWEENEHCISVRELCRTLDHYSSHALATELTKYSPDPLLPPSPLSNWRYQHSNLLFLVPAQNPTVKNFLCHINSQNDFSLDFLTNIFCPHKCFKIYSLCWLKPVNTEKPHFQNSRTKSLILFAGKFCK